MMSQNRQDTKDRLRGELDFDVNRRAEREIQSVTHKLNLLDDKMGDVAELLRRHVALAGGNDSRPLSSGGPLSERRWCARATRLQSKIQEVDILL